MIQKGIQLCAMLSDEWGTGMAAKVWHACASIVRVRRCCLGLFCRLLRYGNHVNRWSNAQQRPLLKTLQSTSRQDASCCLQSIVVVKFNSAGNIFFGSHNFVFWCSDWPGLPVTSRTILCLPARKSLPLPVTQDFSFCR